MLTRNGELNKIQVFLEGTRALTAATNCSLKPEVIYILVLAAVASFSASHSPPAGGADLFGCNLVLHFSAEITKSLLIVSMGCRHLAPVENAFLLVATKQKSSPSNTPVPQTWAELELSKI